MKKNVCICRHFQRLNKNSALGRLRKFRNKANAENSSDSFEDLCKGTLKGGRKAYLDVWLVDFFSPSLSTNTSDTTSLFILQLACIVNMVPRWKRLKLRVFIIDQSTNHCNVQNNCSNHEDGVSNDTKPQENAPYTKNDVG